MENKICCILNYAPHYRQAIYRLMDNELECDFYFGSRLQTGIKKIDYSGLKNARELHSVWSFKKIYWMVNSISLIFKPYKKYLITGQINCISNWIFLPLARLAGKEVYLWNHGWYGKETSFQKLIKKIYYSQVKGFFLYGEYAKGLMIEQGFAKEKLHVVYNSLNYQQSLENRQNVCKTAIYSNYFGNERPVLLFIGRLQPVKKLDMILSVLKIQKQKGIIYNLVFIGEGSDKENLIGLSKEYDVEDQVWFYGACYDENLLASLIFNADLCVSPGNVGLTAIHALSYGTPVITHNYNAKQGPEFEAIVPGVTGDYFEHNNPISLQEEIVKWFEKHPHKDNILINACYQVIDEKYNPFYQIEVMKNILKQP